MSVKLFFRTLERSKLMYHELFEVDKRISKYLKGIPFRSSLLNNSIAEIVKDVVS